MRVNVDLDEDVLMKLFNQAKPLGRSRKRHMEMILEEAVKGKTVNIGGYEMPFKEMPGMGDKVALIARKEESKPVESGKGEDVKAFWKQRFEQKNK